MPLVLFYCLWIIEVIIPLAHYDVTGYEKKKRAIPSFTKYLKVSQNGKTSKPTDGQKFDVKFIVCMFLLSWLFYYTLWLCIDEQNTLPFIHRPNTIHSYKESAHMQITNMYTLYIHIEMRWRSVRGFQFA